MARSPVLYLVRHGETAFNREGRYQGQMDSALTDLGVAQARAVGRLLARHLKKSSPRVLCSPLGRAQKTAEIICAALHTSPTPEPEPRLKEVGMGAWDGMTRAEITARWPDARRGRSTREWMFHGPGGETIEDLSERLFDLLTELRDSEQTCLLVSHAVSGRIIRALHGQIPVLDALKLDAPQDAAFRLLPWGSIEMICTDDYLRRQGQIT